MGNATIALLPSAAWLPRSFAVAAGRGELAEWAGIPAVSAAATELLERPAFRLHWARGRKAASARAYWASPRAPATGERQLKQEEAARRWIGAA